VCKGGGCIYRVHQVVVNDESIFVPGLLECIMQLLDGDVQEVVFGSKAEARTEQVASRLAIEHGVGDERMACRASVPPPPPRLFDSRKVAGKV
jgi:hypothetical protein